MCTSDRVTFIIRSESGYCPLYSHQSTITNFCIYCQTIINALYNQLAKTPILHFFLFFLSFLHITNSDMHMGGVPGYDYATSPRSLHLNQPPYMYSSTTATSGTGTLMYSQT